MRLVSGRWMQFAQLITVCGHGVQPRYNAMWDRFVTHGVSCFYVGTWRNVSRISSTRGAGSEPMAVTIARNSAPMGDDQSAEGDGGSCMAARISAGRPSMARAGATRSTGEAARARPAGPGPSPTMASSAQGGS